MAKTIQSPRAGAFTISVGGQTIFNYMSVHILDGPLWGARRGAVNGVRSALTALRDAPLTNVQVSDQQWTALVDLVNTLPDFFRYGSLAYAILEAT